MEWLDGIDRSWLKDVRLEERIVADKFSKQIYKTLAKNINSGRVNVTFDYLGWEKCNEQDKLDMDLVKICVKKTVESKTLASVMGYTGWLACKIIRSKNYSIQELPEPDYDKLQERCGVPRKLLEEVVSKLTKEKNLPLVGRIENSYLIPDEGTLRKYEDLYDWGEQK